MAPINSIQSASYELPLPVGGAVPAGGQAGAETSLPEPLLLKNVSWFCRLRWVVAALFALFGLAGLWPALRLSLGLRPHIHWPIVTAVVLALANLGFLAHARLLAKLGSARGAQANLWAQIVMDLLVLTVVVHHVGSLETYVAFAYLFHIVLACIFFSRPRSLAIAAVACALYLLCVTLEVTGALPHSGIYADSTLREHMERTLGAALLNGVSAIAIWVIIWYLASHLSEMVRDRDNELAETNRRLLEAQRERRRHMLRTTHELKAPFAAIHANVHMLLRGHQGDLPQQAREVLDRIATRCRRLATEINEMLQLANLDSAVEQPLRWAEVDLGDVLRWCLGQVQPLAEERGVAVEDELQAASAHTVEDHMKMLFTNLLANAIIYSRRGGKVHVRCAPGVGPEVSIEDHGIGIAPDKLPRIFEEYYRTNEAVHHNKESTGLGLAIVRRVAETHAIRIRVESEPSVGTKFVLKFPPPPA